MAWTFSAKQSARRPSNYGAKVVAWTVDEGKSGTLDAVDRPGLLDALTAIRDGRADGLIVRDFGPARPRRDRAGGRARRGLGA